MQEEDDPLKILSVYKTFKSKNGHKVFAVNNVSFGVPNGVVFGLLGQNGAGSMLFL